MRFALYNIVSIHDFLPFSSKLSESGQKFISCLLVQNAYTIAGNHYHQVGESLKRYRDASGRAIGGSLEPSSYRLETELVSLVTLSLISMPKIDKIIDNDTKTTEEDKKYLKEAYAFLNGKIEALDKMLGLPCFGVKKKEE